MTDADQKAAIRERMASTGENYTTARRAIELARLKARSGQPDSTLAEQRTRTLNERFDTVAGQLGSDNPPAVRLAGVYAMAGLADDWQDHRQMCVDVLCAYLRMPYEPEPGDDAPVEKRLAFQASREIRHTVIRVIAAHLNGTAPVSWCGLNFDFAGAVFDGGDFSDAKFSGGTVNFVGAEFSGGTVDFSRVASWTHPPDFGSGFDMSHPPAGVMPPALRRLSSLLWLRDLVRSPRQLPRRHRSGLRGGPCYGFQREVNDLVAVQLFAPSDTQAEFGVGEVLVQQRRRLAKAVGVGAEGRRATAG
jgi:hypothetical protein